jgi:hypothetical protein
MIFLPKEVLRPLPVAYGWDDIDTVCTHNKEVRQRINHIIGDTWKKATSRNVSKQALRNALLRNPEALRDLLSQYRAKPANRYDFERDPDGELVWNDIAKEYAKRFPLELEVEPHVTADSILEVVTTVCNHFRRLVENNGMHEAFYNDSGEQRHERFAQLLFFAVADAYCTANDLDLNREPNAGRGPVDFKLSRGYKAKVNVEVKYSSNRKLVDGFTTQLGIYDKAEQTQHSVYLVIRTTESTTAIDTILELRSKELREGKKVPDIIVVDGRPKPSASRA